MPRSLNGGGTIHAHPELRFEEHRTSAKVTDLLNAFGCDDVVTGIGQTGVVGVIHGRAQGSGKVIGFRADMDALPITENTGVPHASTHPGVMHACGHDGHTAMLLGAAKYLAETRNFDGSVVLIFQPAEEGGGGARAMLENGLMTRWGIQEVYGMHNWPGIPTGKFAVRDGPQMAATAFFEITVKGRGGHAALPHKAVDTTVTAAQVIVGTADNRRAQHRSAGKPWLFPLAAYTATATPTMSSRTRSNCAEQCAISTRSR